MHRAGDVTSSLELTTMTAVTHLRSMLLATVCVAGLVAAGCGATTPTTPTPVAATPAPAPAPPPPAATAASYGTSKNPGLAELLEKLRRS